MTTRIQKEFLLCDAEDNHLGNLDGFISFTLEEARSNAKKHSQVKKILECHFDKDKLDMGECGLMESGGYHLASELMEGQAFTLVNSNQIHKIKSINEQAVHGTHGFNAYRTTFEMLIKQGQITLLD